MFRPVRKKANEIGVGEAKKLLHEARRGVLAVNGDGGYPYAVPVNYLYDEEKQEIETIITGLDSTASSYNYSSANGYLAAYCNSLDFAHGIAATLNSQSYAAMCRNARAKALKAYDEKAVAKAYAAVYAME